MSGRRQQEPTCYEFLAVDGQVHCVELNGTPIVNNGEVVEVVCVGRDVTDRKRAEESKRRQAAAEAANEAKNAFLARMSHEIRTPLNGVVGMLDLLGDTELNERQRHYHQIATMSVDTLLGLVNDILDFSKIQAGMLDLERVEFDLHALLREVAGMFVDRARDKGMELLCTIDPAVPRSVTGTPAQIRQIIVNLVDNALKFTPHGEVQIHARLEAKQEGITSVRFAVRDTGIGIPEDRRDHLFDPFSQIDTSTTRKYGGTGLGLSICKQLAELLGGWIDVDSKLGQGSLFSAIIPLAAPHIPSAVAGAAAIAAGTNRPPRPTAEKNPGRLEETARNSAGGRILIADDNEINQLVVSEILQRGHFHCTIVSNGRMALEAMRVRPFDIVLMDCEMPEMDGFTATREIRKLEDLDQLAARGEGRCPIIALTAHVDEGYRQKCLSAGMDDYLSKPIDSERLLTTIRRWMIRTNRTDNTRHEPATVHEGAGCSSTRCAAEGPFTAAGGGPAARNGPVVVDTALAGNKQPPLDIKTLRDRCLGNGDMMQRVLRLFTQRVSADLLRIHDAIWSNDAPTARKLAHALKGAVANVSATAAAQHAAALETLANDHRLIQAQEQFLRLERELARCVAFVEPLLHGASAGAVPQV
jgi:signal transduction histidine kinase/CheY-like chemotaxis protein/HPt (histidine-containing phosphotransfer) domain-containing protein